MYIPVNNSLWPYAKFYVYPTMPVMLCTNICLSFDLNNGDIRKIVKVLTGNLSPLESNYDFMNRKEICTFCVS